MLMIMTFGAIFLWLESSAAKEHVFASLRDSDVASATARGELLKASKIMSESCIIWMFQQQMIYTERRAASKSETWRSIA